jgi:hypothetical protein
MRTRTHALAAAGLLLLTTFSGTVIAAEQRLGLANEI